jgi:hypothetical protein
MNKKTFIAEIENLSFKYNKEDDFYETKKSMLCFRDGFINITHGREKNKSYKYEVFDRKQNYQNIIKSFNFILAGEL